jgi:hypothetical protein
MVGTARVRDTEGFRGSIAGLSLADVIQLNGNNGFSGCITVRYGADMGRIFFREGKIIHAERGDQRGEAAFYDIMAWRTGHFSLDPNVATTAKTIDKSSQYILMEAYRLMDERRAAQAREGSLAAERELAADHAHSPIAERIGALPGVAYAVLMGQNGSCVDDASPHGATLAGDAAYLALVGSQLGAAFTLGPLVSAAVHTSDPARHVLVIARSDHYLGVLAETDADLVSVEGGVRDIAGEEV